jgi:flagella basal body P-ring formation protein FlgA
MRLAILLVACCVVRAASVGQGSCAEAQGVEISGRDLAAVLPAFDRLPPELLLGSMPLPGSRRTFHAAELASLAQRYSIHLDAAPEICFEWAMESLSKERILSAMQAALPASGARIEIVETSLYAVPRGTVEFPLSGLGKPASPDQRAPVLWRGEVIYGGSRRYSVWARVRIAAPCDRVFAAESLKAGIPIEARQLRIQPAECFPDVNHPAASPDSVIGLAPLRPIAAGAEVRMSLVGPLNDVNRGDLIDIEVRSGAARLALIGKAESGGRSGDLIAVRNPSSNRIFQARINGKARAIVLADLPRGN